MLRLPFMTLDDTQRKKVAEWIAAGLKLSEIQNRLASDLGVRMTYMDVRLLVDDLKLTPKDVERAKPATVLPAANAKGGPAKMPEASAARSLEARADSEDLSFVMFSPFIVDRAASARCLRHTLTRHRSPKAIRRTSIPNGTAPDPRR